MLVQEMIKDFYGIQSELNRIFTRPSGGAYPSVVKSYPPVVKSYPPVVSSYPSVVISSGKDDLTLEAKLPGADPEKISLTVKNKELRISGEIPEASFTSTDNKEPGKKEYKTHRIERWSGKFERVLTLPKSVEGDNVEASYKDGILKLTLPIKEEEKARQISVKVK